MVVSMHYKLTHTHTNDSNVFQNLYWLRVWNGMEWNGMDWIGLDWIGMDWLTFYKLEIKRQETLKFEMKR